MTVAVVDGEPPLPPEHPSPPPIWYSNLSEEEENKHSAASFILRISHHGTERHVPNNVAIFNGRHGSDHDPHRSTDKTITTHTTKTTTPTTEVDDDDDDFFVFLEHPETSDSAENTANTITLERSTPPQHHTTNNYYNDTTTNLTTTPTTDADDDDDDFFAFLNLQETSDSAVHLTLNQVTPPHHAIDDNDDATTTNPTPTTTATPTPDDDDDFFELPDLPAAFYGANVVSTFTIDRVTPQKPTIADNDDARTTTTINPTTTKTSLTDDADDDAFFATLLTETHDCAVNVARDCVATPRVPTLDRATPPQHSSNNYYDTATTKTTNPATTTDDDDDDNEFFEFLNLPATVASKANSATIDDKDDATTTMPPKTKHDTLAQNQPTLVATTQRYDLQMMLASTQQQYANDIDTCTHKTTTPTPTTPLAPQDKSEHKNATASLEPAFPSTQPTTTHPSNPFDMPRPPEGPTQFTGHVTARRTEPMAMTPEFKPLSMETRPPNPDTCTIPVTDTTHWIHNSCTLLFQAVDRMADFATPLLMTTMLQKTKPTTANTTNHTPDQYNNTTSKPSNRISPTQSTAELAKPVANNFAMMPPMPPPVTTNSPTWLSDSHIPDSDMASPTTCHSENTIQWLSDSFAQVFMALDRLAIEIANFSDRILEATSKRTPCPQPQPLYPRLYQLLHMVTRSCHSTKPITKHQPHTHQQNPYPEQSHQRHRNHTKYQHFFYPIPHYHFSKGVPLPVNISRSTYHRYLAHNFQPP